MIKFIPHCVLFAASLLALSAQASGIDGDMVDVAIYFPDSSTLYKDFGAETITAAGTVFDYSPGVTLTVSPEDIVIDFIVQSTVPATSFTGFILTDLSEHFPMLSLRNDSTLTSGFSYSTAGENFYLNLSGLTGNAGDTIAFTTLPPVPEPQTCTLLAAGLCLLGLATRRFKSGRRPARYSA